MSRSRLVLLSVLIVAWFPARSHAQLTAGAALAFATGTFRTAETAPVPSEVLPTGTPAAVTAFVAASGDSRLGVQGEVSVPGRTSWTGTYSMKIGYGKDTIVHRDVLVSGLVRVAVSRGCVILGGAGAAFSYTSGTDVYTDRSTPPGGTYTGEQTVRSTHLVLSLGGDFPVRLARHFSLVPTVRIHYIARSGPELSDPVFPPVEFGNLTLRTGVGGMVSF